MTPSTYRKLTSRRRRLLGYSQLWMGEGHLLLVRSVRLVEHYQRFSLQDIQAIVISDGPNFVVLQVLAILASLGWGSVALAVSSTFAKSFFGITGAFGLLLAVIDIARGPRCRCVLHTAVSRELLPPVRRRNASGKFLAEVMPAIEAAQGSLSPEQLQGAAAHSLERGPAPPQQPEVKRARNYAAEILFGLLVVDAGLVWIGLRTSLPNVVGLLPSVYLAELILAGVMVTQRHAMRAVLLMWGILTLVLVVADISTVSGMGAWAAFMNSAQANANNEAARRELSSLWLSARDTALVSTFGRLAVGAVGLALCYVDRRRYRDGNPV